MRVGTVDDTETAESVVATVFAGAPLPPFALYAKVLAFADHCANNVTALGDMVKVALGW